MDAALGPNPPPRRDLSQSHELQGVGTVAPRTSPAYLRNLSAAGIHTTTFTFEPDGVWSTAPAVARGGAPAGAVDGAELAGQPFSHGRAYDEETIWDNFAYFMERIALLAAAGG